MIYRWLFFLQGNDRGHVCCPLHCGFDDLIKIEVSDSKSNSLSDSYSISSSCSLVNPSIKFTSKDWSFKSRDYFPRWKTFISFIISPKVKCIDPFLQFMIAFTVSRKGRPRMTGVCAFGFCMDCVSRTMKSTG